MYKDPSNQFGSTVSSWLHYDEVRDLAFCHICSRAENTGKLMPNSSCKDEAFLSCGFFNWKDATQGFRCHEKSKCHLDAVHAVVELPRTTGDVGKMLSNSHKQEKAANRNVFLKIVDNIRYFTRQGLPLCSHNDAESNFSQLFQPQK